VNLEVSDLVCWEVLGPWCSVFGVWQSLEQVVSLQLLEGP
jgi:hypothetical protein